MRFLFGFLCLTLSAFGQVVPLNPLFGFEPNLGQFPPAVRFVRRTPYNFLYLTRDSVVLRNGIRLQIDGVGSNVVPEGDSPTSTVYNFYQGNNSSAWRTNVRLFSGVRLTNVSPGVSVLFTEKNLTLNNVGQIKLLLTAQPGADLSNFRLRVLNTGAAAKEDVGGIWFAGGRIPSPYIVLVQTTQSTFRTASSLKIESADSLSVQIPFRDPTLPTQVEITVVSYDLDRDLDLPAKASDGNRYLTTSTQVSTDFGEDGPDVVVARLDDTGKPLWVTLFGGAKEDSVSFNALSNNGIVLSGTTSSTDFPVTSNAPRSKLESSKDAFLAFFDRDSGQLRNSTYSGIEGPLSVIQQEVDKGRDVALSGGSGDKGYLLRWQPVENRFVYSLRFDSPAGSLAFDTDSNLYFATMNHRVGLVDPNGKLQGSFVALNSPSADVFISDIRLVPAPNREVWVFYQLGSSELYSLPRLLATKLWATKMSIVPGQILVNRTVVIAGRLANAALAPSGNLKLLVDTVSPREVTTPDAQLAGKCLDSNYFLILSPFGQTLYASYVPVNGFDFAAQNQAPASAPVKLSCIANSAGRAPLFSAAPGQLVTVTGGGFGPAAPVYAALDARGMYPLSLGGFAVRIAGVNAPVVAVARGLISVQIPFEAPSPGPIELFENGRLLDTLPLSNPNYDYALGYFDTGDLDSVSSFPVLTALNEDGTVNSKANPAVNGAIVTLFGSGLGALSPPLVTGGQSPGIPLSYSIPYSQGSSYTFPRGAGWREILYLGSAPGLSTFVFQVNLRLLQDEPSAEVHAHPIGLSLGILQKFPILPFPASGVVYVK